MSATTLIADSGTTTRLATTLDAITGLGQAEIHLTAFEAPSLLLNRSAVQRRKELFLELGVSASFLPLLSQRGPGGRTAMVRAASLVLRTRKLRPKPDLVFGLNADAAAACALADFGADTIAVYEMHGIESEEAIVARSVERGSSTHRRRLRIEQRALEWADHIVCPSLAAEAWAADLAEVEATWHELPTLSPLRVGVEELQLSRQDARAELGWSDKQVLTYIGGMNSWQQPDLMAEVFKHLADRNSDWRFLVLTRDTQVATAALTAHGVDSRLIHVTSAEHADVPRWGAAGDLGLLLRSDHLMNRVASPTKYAEYLEMGVPVATTTGLPSFAALTSKHGLGLVVDSAAQAHTIARDIDQFAVGSDRETLSRFCRQVARDHFRPERAESIYAQVLNHKRDMQP